MKSIDYRYLGSAAYLGMFLSITLRNEGTKYVATCLS